MKIVIYNKKDIPQNGSTEVRGSEGCSLLYGTLNSIPPMFYQSNW